MASSKHRNKIIQLFHGRCLLNPIHAGTDVHEIVPKSQRPKTWDELDNQVLLCHNCHIGIVHRDGAKNWQQMLLDKRKAWIEKFATSDLLVS